MKSKSKLCTYKLVCVLDEYALTEYLQKTFDELNLQVTVNSLDYDLPRNENHPDFINDTLRIRIDEKLTHKQLDLLIRTLANKPELCFFKSVVYDIYGDTIYISLQSDHDFEFHH
jgi:hypothetical protein